MFATLLLIYLPVPERLQEQVGHKFYESLPDAIKFLDSLSNQDQKIIIV